MLILLSIGIGSAAFNTAQNILYLGLALLLSSLILSGILSWLNFHRCRWRLRLPERLRAGERAEATIEIHNGKRWLPSFSLSFHLETGDIQASLPLPGRLDPGQEARLAWNWVPEHRGRQAVRLRGLNSLYPFGFLNKTIEDTCTAEVLVWPRRAPWEGELPRIVSRSRSGGSRARARGGVELRALREHRPGDPLRSVHWKASARQGRLMVRELEEERTGPVILEVEALRAVWDRPAQFEHLCATAATLAEDLFHAGRLESVEIQRVGHPTRRLRDLHVVLDALALLEPAEHLGPRAPTSASFHRLRLAPGPGETIRLIHESDPTHLA